MRAEFPPPGSLQDDPSMWWIDWSRRGAFAFEAMTAADIRGNPDNLSPEAVEFMLWHWLMVHKRLEWERTHPVGDEFPGAFLHDPPPGCEYPKPPKRRST
jgi:hypothetical protein